MRNSLPDRAPVPMTRNMTKRINNTGPGAKRAAIAGAIGSAAVAAAVLYVNRRSDKKRAEAPPPVTPSGEPPETD